MGKHVRSIVIVVLIFIAIIFIVDKLFVSQSSTTKLTYSELYSQVDAGNVKDVTISGQHDVVGDLRKPVPTGGDTRFTSTILDDTALLSDMRKHDVAITVDNSSPAPIVSMLVQLIPFALMALLLLFILRQAQSGGSQALSSAVRERSCSMRIGRR